MTSCTGHASGLPAVGVAGTVGSAGTDETESSGAHALGRQRHHATAARRAEPRVAQPGHGLGRADDVVAAQLDQRRERRVQRLHAVGDERDVGRDARSAGRRAPGWPSRW